MGMPLSKASYNTIMWSIVGVLVVALAFFVFRYKKSHIHTSEARKNLAEVEKEFDAYRVKALEKEQRLRTTSTGREKQTTESSQVAKSLYGFHNLYTLNVRRKIQFMRIDIITVVPDILKSPFEASILKRAIEKGLVEIHLHNLRDYVTDNYKQVDDYQFGGGAGMVMMIEPIDKCITALKKERDYDEVIYMTPDGETLKQGIANEISLKENLIILCGHYKGVDQRVREHFITREISVGDYVLSGGELGAAVLCDAVIRLLPGSSWQRNFCPYRFFSG